MTASWKRVVGAGIIALGFVLQSQLVSSAQETPQHAAVKPAPRDANWLKRHEGFVALAKKGNVDVLFLGDSITDAWRSSGKNVWAKHFEPLRAANFGIGGDRTQHVLWRLQNGELEGIQPKVVVLMIGTNNSNGKDNTAEEIADGVTAIVKEIHTKSPQTKVLLLGIFPRGTPDKHREQREKIKTVNGIIAKLDDGKRVKYVDIGSKFIEPNSTISKEIMPDLLHLSEKGYEIWAEAIKGTVEEMMGKKCATLPTLSECRTLVVEPVISEPQDCDP